MLTNEDVTLRKATIADMHPLYELLTTDEKWTQFNGPYFPYTAPSLAEFESGLFARLCQGERALVIEFDGTAVGTVSFYWEDEGTRWLEIGIVIYDSKSWGNGIGRKALVPWITHLFNQHEIERVGLTTWSGNPRMIACAEALGMTLEAQIRKVRYHNGVYYDSVKLGVLRSEWFDEENNHTNV